MTGFRDWRERRARNDDPLREQQEATRRSTQDATGRASASMRARTRDLQEADAFEPAHPDEMSMAITKLNMRLDHARTRRRCVVAGIALVLVVLVSLCIPYGLSGGTFLYLRSPGEVAEAYRLWLTLNVGPLFDASLQQTVVRAPIVRAYQDMGGPYIVDRGAQTLLVLLAGFLLALSGMLFQGAFRNPLAAPSTLGAADGVNIGYMIFMMLGYMNFAQNRPLFFACTYGAGFATMGIVLGLARLVNGKGRFSVFDMLLVGTVLAQLFGTVVTFYTSYFISQDAYYEFYDFQYAMGNGSEPIVLVSVVVVALLTVVPTYLLRFRLNLVCFTDEEGITLGVDPGRLRFVALGLATTMVIGSIVAVGQVAIVSLAVPYLVRYAFGADMRRQMLGNFFLGSLILLACEAIASLLAFGSTMAPVALIVNLAVVPFFIWMMALQRRSWE